MASVVPLRPAADPTAGRAAAPPARPVPPGGLLARLAGVARRALTRRRLRAFTDRQLRDIGLARADVADPLEACRQARAWGEHGSAGWTSGSRAARW